MKVTLKNIGIKILIAFMAVQILNLSVDAEDFEPLRITNNTVGNFNYMNSVTEYVAEVLLDYKNAFPEYQKSHSSSKSQVVKHISFKVFSYNDEFVLKNYNARHHIYIRPFNENKTCSYVQEINPPPPKLQLI